MRGDGRVRHCTHCDRKVYNLSDMSQLDASSFLREHEGRVCVRFYQRSDGTLMTKDCGLAERAVVKTKAIVVGLLTAVGFCLFPVTTMGARMNPRTEMKHHLRKVQQYSADIKAEKDPETRASLKELRKRHADMAKVAAQRLMEEEG